ncbi:MAG: 4-(cytidine 5'-diphospho)-2-C-methyl-D-erythritol kinase [Candidatus Hydrogenedentota bacterium]
MQLTVLSPAKLNLFLRVLEPGTDGYHQLQSLFVPISLFDQIEVSLVESKYQSINISNPATSDNPQNDLIYRACVLFCNFFNHKYNIDIKVKKNIPVGSGLGGGSSNAASILNALNTIFASPFTLNDLQLLGSKLGSDVPFFINPGISLISGRGEIIHSIDKFPKIKFLLISNLMNSSTSSVYKQYDSSVKSYPKRFKETELKKLITNLKSEDINILRGSIFNDLFKPFIELYPDQIKFKNKIEALLNLPLFLSGSGSMFFVPLLNKELQEIKNQDMLAKFGSPNIFYKFVEVVN